MKGKETGHLKAFISGKLKADEKVAGHLDGWIGDMMGKGAKKQHNGQFVLTNERVCFYRKGIFGEVLETIPLTKITSVETLSMMGYRVLRLHTSHDELAFKTFENKEFFDGVYEAIENLRHFPTEKELQKPQSVTNEIPDQIRKLAELRDSGVLTEAEFDAKKAELLSRM